MSPRLRGCSFEMSLPNGIKKALQTLKEENRREKPTPLSADFAEQRPCLTDAKVMKITKIITQKFTWFKWVQMEYSDSHSLGLILHSFCKIRKSYEQQYLLKQLPASPCGPEKGAISKFYLVDFHHSCVTYDVKNLHVYPRISLQKKCF